MEGSETSGDVCQRPKGPDQKDGGETRDRTGDTTIFNRMLYQLSYLATPGERATTARKPRS